MSEFQELIQKKGEEIFNRAGKQSSGSVFDKSWWYGKIMDWSMRNEQFKTQMFRFVDVLPYLNSNSEVATHLKEYFAEGGDELPSIFNTGVNVGSLAPALMSGAIRKNVTQMAKLFITGATPKEALPLLKKKRKNKIAFTADLLGEATLSEKEALNYQSRYIELLSWLSEDAQKWEKIEQIDQDDQGLIPAINISVKISAIYSQIKNTAWENSKEQVKGRLRPILDAAIEKNIFINIDMEDYHLKDFTLEVFKEIICEEKYAQYPHWGIVVQAYLRDSFSDIKDLCEFAKKRQIPFTVRLVKGAYWDYEVIFAKQQNWPIPVYTIKQESDANYEKCGRLLLDEHPHIKVAFGSHNIRSLSAMISYAEKKQLPPAAFEIQMLYGMADPFKQSLVDMGYRIREYATIGELIPGMAYLVRRLLENSSNESFLRQKFSDGKSNENLLSSPEENLSTSSDQVALKPEEFYNEPLLDWNLKDNRFYIQKALDEFKAKEFPLIINNKDVVTSQTIESLNPSHPEQSVGKISMAQTEQAEQAIEAAKKAFVSWKKTPLDERTRIMESLIEKILEKRFELIALEIKEVGKPWGEADGDITEAIDFCRYYLKEMKKLSEPKRVGHAPGEVSHYIYQPKGVTAVIAPWNFPLAILTGMVSAAIITGNTVVMKPAEQSSAIAGELMNLLREAGLPPGVVNYLPGYGEVVGEYLVNHKDISLITFTGSKDVGLQIIRKASVVHKEQQQVKRCITEMGGKNALIIDSDADLDEAVIATVYSAFGFQGQKCSACSRVIVLESNYERFIERLKETTKSISVGFAEDGKTIVGPVIDKNAQKNILEFIEMGKKEAHLFYQGETPKEGYFIPPTIFTDVKSNMSIAQKEAFGPLLAVIKVKTFEEAIDVANDTEYALTGGLFSRSPSNIEYAKSHLEVGNLYINRNITGAMVDRHPFGGYKMSGIGSKTGGPDYLLQFLEPRVVIENTVRRGFTPDALS